MSASPAWDFCSMCDLHADSCRCVRCSGCGVMFDPELGDLADLCLGCEERPEEEMSDA